MAKIIAQSTDGKHQIIQTQDDLGYILDTESGQMGAEKHLLSLLSANIDWIDPESDFLQKHLPGQHDQKDHGKPGGGEYALLRDERTVVQDYAEGYFKDMNTALRQGVVSARMERDIANMDKALEQGDVDVSDPDTELWRVVTAPEKVYHTKNLAELVGKAYLDPGYASFSSELSDDLVTRVAELHDAEDVVVLHIVGASTPIHGLRVDKLAHWSSEKEVILPRGLKYRVVGWNEEDNVLDVKVEHD